MLSKAVVDAVCVVRLINERAPETVSSAHLAQRLGMKRDAIQKVVHPLVRGGLLTSTLGRVGGFRLTRPLAEITLAEVVEAFGGRTHLEIDPSVDAAALAPLIRAYQDGVDEVRRVLGATSIPA